MRLQQIIQRKIKEALHPLHLEVSNESFLHRVPPGSETHFKLVVVSPEFEGKNPLARHRLIHSLLAPELKSGVHALSLHVFTPAEWKQKGQLSQESPPCLGGSK